MVDKESLRSDHTDYEKFAWKIFRSKLNEVGLISNILLGHEAAVSLRIRELIKCGLCDVDGLSLLYIDNKALRSLSLIC